MKRSWLLWVILLALAATAFAAAPKKNQSPTRQRRDRHFLGSFSILLESLRAPPDNWYESTSIPGALEPSRLPLFIPDNWNERMSIPGAEDLALEPSRLLSPRPGLRTRRAAVGRPRGRTRAICRGCYSGLMIVAPPVPETQNGSLTESLSESEGDSSEGD